MAHAGCRTALCSERAGSADHQDALAVTRRLLDCLCEELTLNCTWGLYEAEAPLAVEAVREAYAARRAGMPTLSGCAILLAGPASVRRCNRGDQPAAGKGPAEELLKPPRRSFSSKGLITYWFAPDMIASCTFFESDSDVAISTGSMRWVIRADPFQDGRRLKPFHVPFERAAS